MKRALITLLLYSFLVTVVYAEATSPSSSRVCYTDHNDYNETKCFDHSLASKDIANVKKSPTLMSNITANSLLETLNTTESVVFVVFYDNTTLFSSKFIYSFTHAIKELRKTNLNPLFATMRVSDEPRFAAVNGINNDVDLRIFLPGYERLKFPFEISRFGPT